METGGGAGGGALFGGGAFTAGSDAREGEPACGDENGGGGAGCDRAAIGGPPCAPAGAAIPINVFFPMSPMLEGGAGGAGAREGGGAGGADVRGGGPFFFPRPSKISRSERLSFTPACLGLSAAMLFSAL